MATSDVGIESLGSQTGTTWGLATLFLDRPTDRPTGTDPAWAFTAAFLRAHAKVGPSGLGEIYRDPPVADPVVPIPLPLTLL
ncbi:MAG: hypothetical protein ACT4PP_14825 [Sporichthyaceae bacterium]